MTSKTHTPSQIPKTPVSAPNLRRDAPDPGHMKE